MTGTVSEPAARPGSRWSPSAPPEPRPRLLAGTACIGLALAAGRWGAYLPVGPVFVLDVLIMLSVAVLLIGRAQQVRPPVSASARAWPGVTPCVLLAYVMLRWVVGSDHSLTSVRDVAPYGYCAVAFLSAYSIHRCAPQARARTLRILGWALSARLAWVAVAEWLPGVVAGAPVVDPAQGLRMFAIRAASDGTVLGVAAALALPRLRRGTFRRHGVVVLVAAAVVASLATRAALLATVTALVLTGAFYFLASGRRGASPRRRVLVLGALPLVALTAIFVVPQTTAGSKLASSFGLSEASRQSDYVGLGTKRARQIAWARVLRYVDEQDAAGTGVGFGPNYLAAADAVVPLGGEADLRAPHNFLIGTYARIGLIGLGLFLAVVVAAAREAVRLRRVAADDPLILLAIVLPAALLISALFGVEMEAPFVAVPFYWCLGVLLSRPVAAPVPGL